jgi:two-component system, OmpR family, sensor kinase
MKLRRKLFTIFAALAVMSLLSGVLSVWSTVRQHALLDALDGQYEQNVLQQRIRTNTGALFRKYAVSAILETPNAAAHFDEDDARVRKDLEKWSSMNLGPPEVRRAQELRESYGALSGRLLEALSGTGVNMVGEVPGKADFDSFRELMEGNLEENMRTRATIQERLQGLREAIQLAAAISGFGTLCLVLLLWAYVASDIFAPLRDLESALSGVARGDLKRRLDAGRDDELGLVSAAFNRAMDGISDLTRGVPAAVEPRESGLVPTVRRHEEEVRAVVGELLEAVDSPPTAGLGRAVVARAEELCATVERILILYQPADLRVEVVDVSALLYEAVASMHGELSRRAVGIHVEVEKGLPALMADRRRLRSILDALLGDVVASPRAEGALLQLRGGLAEDSEGSLVLELTIDPRREGDAWHEARDDQSIWSAASVAFLVARQAIEQHGGTLTVHDTPEGRRSAIAVLPLLPPIADGEA